MVLIFSLNKFIHTFPLLFTGIWLCIDNLLASHNCELTLFLKALYFSILPSLYISGEYIKFSYQHISIWCPHRWYHPQSTISDYCDKQWQAWFQCVFILMVLKELKSDKFLEENDPMKPENYRPVSILVALFKVFEGILSDQIMCYINVFSPMISLYRKHHSCTNALLKWTKVWAKHLMTIWLLVPF